VPPVLLRTSERGTFKRCRFKWYLEFVEHRKPIRDVPPLRFGTLIHSALASYYKPGVKRGPHPAKTFERLYLADVKEAETFGFRVGDDQEWVDAGDLGVAMLENYVETYGSDSDWEVVVTEQPFRLPIKHERPFEYVGVLDGVWRHRPTKKLYIVDHKTAKSINTRYLLLDEQASAYWTFGVEWLYRKGMLKKNQKLAGIVFNFLRKVEPDVRPTNGLGQKLNKDGTVSKIQPAPYFERKLVLRDDTERQRTYDQVQLEHNAIEAVREGGLDVVYKTAGAFTCGGCWAFDTCELHEIGQDWRDFMEETTKTWDPYAEHEILEAR